MIASGKQQHCASAGVSPTFEDLLSSIERRAAVALRSLPPSEREDLVAEAVANAFCAYQRLVQRGLGQVIYATPLSRYAIQQIRSGRRVGNRLNIKDVSSTYAQRAKVIRLERLDMRDDTGGRWQEVIVEDKTAGPAEIAITRIDFVAWLKLLTPRTRRIAKTLATGETTKEVARKFALSQGRVSQLHRELQLAWQMFQGETAAA